MSEVTVSREARCDRTCAVLEVAECDGGSRSGSGPSRSDVDRGPCVERCDASEGEAGGRLSDFAFGQLNQAWTYSHIYHLTQIIPLNRSMPLHIRQSQHDRMLRYRLTIPGSKDRLQRVSPKLETYSRQCRLRECRDEVQLQLPLAPSTGAPTLNARHARNHSFSRRGQK